MLKKPPKALLKCGESLSIRIFQIQIQHGGQCRKGTTKYMSGAAQIKVKPKIPILTVKILFSRKNKNRVDHRNLQAILKSRVTVKLSSRRQFNCKTVYSLLLLLFGSQLH